MSYDFRPAIIKLRRMVGEPDTETYDDDALQEYIEECAVVDPLGQRPTWTSPVVWPPALTANPYWTPTYDLNWAAAKIWTEKAAALSSGTEFDFSDANQSFKRSQKPDQCLKMAAYFTARRQPGTIRQSVDPEYPVTPQVNSPSFP